MSSLPEFRLHQNRLSSLSVSPANAVTPDTEGLANRSQEWVLTERVKEILQTGPLYVGSSSGFTQLSSYLHIGCAECGAVLHIYCPYFNSEVKNRAARIGAIDWHLTGFLFPRARPRKLTMCTAERACCGAKFQD